MLHIFKRLSQNLQFRPIFCLLASESGLAIVLREQLFNISINGLKALVSLLCLLQLHGAAGPQALSQVLLEVLVGRVDGGEGTAAEAELFTSDSSRFVSLSSRSR